MHYYAAPQCPEHLFPTNIRKERLARCKAAEALSLLMSIGSLKVRMPHGFSTKKFVKITKSDLMPKDEEKISDAVKLLSKLSKAKRKTQELNEQAKEAYEYIDHLFEERPLTVEEYSEIEESLKIVSDYAKAVSAYKEALPESQQAKDFLSKALESSTQISNEE